MTALFRIALVAISLGLDVFAVCIGVGVRRPPLRQRLRIGLAFGTAEVCMSILGVVLGRLIGDLIGTVAAYIGFVALFGLGVYMIVESLREGRGELDLTSGPGLFLASISLSLDSLGIGFTLPYLGVPLYEALAAIFVVSLMSTGLGLALGGALGNRVGGASGLAAGIILALTGIGFAAARAFNPG